MGRTTRTTLRADFSEGARQLWGILARRYGGSQSALARELHVAPSQVSKWLYGDVRPNLHSAGVLFATFKIRLELWHQPPAESFTPPAARGAQ